MPFGAIVPFIPAIASAVGGLMGKKGEQDGDQSSGPGWQHYLGMGIGQGVQGLMGINAQNRQNDLYRDLSAAGNQHQMNMLQQQQGWLGGQNDLNRGLSMYQGDRGMDQSRAMSDFDRFIQYGSAPFKAVGAPLPYSQASPFGQAGEATAFDNPNSPVRRKVAQGGQ